MNALRSAFLRPFSLASMLQFFIFVCWGFAFFDAAGAAFSIAGFAAAAGLAAGAMAASAATAEKVTAANAAAIITDNSLFIMNYNFIKKIN